MKNLKSFIDICSSSLQKASRGSTATSFWLKLPCLLLALWVGQNAYSYDFEVDGICYNILDSEQKTLEVTEAKLSEEGFHTGYTGDITIPSSVVYNGETYKVTALGTEAFYMCDSLTSVTISEGVTSLGQSCFDSDRALTSVTIPEGVTSLGKSCFQFCTALSSITIPSSVTSIGSHCFGICWGLKEIICKSETPPSCDSDVFSETKNCKIFVPEASVEAYKEATGWKDFTISGKDPAQLKEIYARAIDEYNGLVVGFQAVKESVNEEYANAATTSTITDQEANIEAMLGTFKSAIEDAYNTCLIDETYDSLMANKSNIETAITKLSEDAATIQKAYDENKAAYDALMSSWTELQANYDAQKASVEKICKDVYSQYTDKLTEIQNAITALHAKIQEQNAASTCIDDTEADNAEIAALNEQIENLVSDAVTAQAQYKENGKVYESLSSSLTDLQSYYEKQTASVETSYKDVLPQFTDKIAALQDSINALKKSIEAEYAAVTLTSKSLDAYNAKISAQIAQIDGLVSDAAAAQAQYEENAKAYETLSSSLTDLQSYYDAQKKSAETNSKDVISDFADELTELQDSITALKKDIEAEHTAVTLTTEGIDAYNAEMTALKALIDDLVSKAAAEQAKYDENAKAYETLSNSLTDLQSYYDKQTTSLETSCKDVILQFANEIAALQDSITTLKKDIEAEHAAVTLTTEGIDAYNTKMTALKDQIDNLVSEAEATETEYKENANVYETLTSNAAALQSYYEKQTASMETSCKDVIAQFSDKIAALQDPINALKKKIEEENAAGTLTQASLDAYNTEITALKKQIDDIVSEAVAAQAEYDTKTSVYETLINNVAALQSYYDKQTASMVTSCKDVIAQFSDKIAALQDPIDALKKKIEEENAAGTLATESLDSYNAEIDVLKKQIDEVINDAVAAQTKYEANASAYANATTDLEALRNKFQEAKETISESYQDAASLTSITDQEAAIEAKIEALNKTIQDAYADGTLSDEYDNVTAEKESIEAAIEKMVGDAKVIQDYIISGIDGVSADNNDDIPTYNLSGQRVVKTARGIVIRGGKKYLVK